MKKNILSIGLMILASFLLGVFQRGQEKKSGMVTEEAPKICKNCNVLLIDIDLLRADALPCYGYFRNTAPNLCNFAKKSLVFKDNYSTASWTLPSMFSTITSLYPTFSGVTTAFVDKLRPDVPTLAETLKKAGYRTVFVAKEEQKYTVITTEGGLRGYDQLITNKSIEEVVDNLSKENGPWFIHYYTGDLHMPYLLPENRQPIEKMEPPKGLPIVGVDFDLMFNKYLVKHFEEIFTDETIKKFKYLIDEGKNSGSLSLTRLFYQHCDGPEGRQYCKKSWDAKYSAYMEYVDQGSEKDRAYLKMLYDTNIKILDERLSKLYSTMDKKPLSSKTVTIVMSDHGEAFGEHGVFSHMDSYHTELYSTPLIIRSPGIGYGNVNDTTSNLDIFPTILKLTGIDSIESLQGKIAITDVKSGNKTARVFVAGEDNSGGIILQNKEWLYYLPVDATSEDQSVLYNKELDPKEKYNVFRKYPAIVKDLYKRASLLLSYNSMILKSKKEPDYKTIMLDSEKVKKLQKEGYF